MSARSSADLLAEHKAWHARAFVPGRDLGSGRGTRRRSDRCWSTAHSSTNRVLMCVALGTDVRDYRRRFVQAQANLTVLRWEVGDGPADAKLLVANDLGHVRAPGELPWS